MGLGSQIKLTSTIERHAAGSRGVVALDAPFLDELLGGDVASRKQDCSRHALREERTGCEPSIVPDARCQKAECENGGMSEAVANSPAEKRCHDEVQKKENMKRNSIRLFRRNAGTNVQRERKDFEKEKKKKKRGCVVEVCLGVDEKTAGYYM